MHTKMSLGNMRKLCWTLLIYELLELYIGKNVLQVSTMMRNHSER